MLLFKKLLLFSLIFFSPLGSPFAHGQSAPPPQSKWLSLNSSHFVVIHSNNSSDLAIKTLVRLEKARTYLIRNWPDLPRYPLTVVIREETDQPNGYATLIPYAHIVIFPVPPSPLESISENSDWLYELCLHELTHIYTLEQRQGAIKFIKPLFGNIISPNLLLPRWWLEGVAVDHETRYSSGGRLRSFYQDAFVRALEKDDKLSAVTIGSINESDMPYWPYGSRPYFYGSLFWSELYEQSGSKSQGDLHLLTGGKAPYTLNSSVKKITANQSIQTIFEKTKGQIKSQVQNQLELLNQDLPTQLTYLNSPFWKEAHSPSLSPNGLMLSFIARNNDDFKSLFLLKRNSVSLPFKDSDLQSLQTAEESADSAGLSLPRPDGPPAGSMNRISWLPNSSGFIYDRIDQPNPYETRSDLWFYQVNSKKYKRLTRNLRAREPSVSPNGDLVSFIQLKKNQTGLGLVSLKTKKISTVLELADQVLSWPTWISDSEIIITSKAPQSFDLIVYNIQNQNISRQVSLFNLCHQGGLTQFKNNKVYFVCGYNGVFNLFQINSDLNINSIEALTHLEIGSWTFDLYSDLSQALISTPTSSGYSLAHVTLNPAPYERLPKIEKIFETRYPIPTSFFDSNSFNPSSIEAFSSDYQPFGYLTPQYWLPFFYTSDKSTALLITTNGFDPLHRHSYTANLLIDEVTESISPSLSYLNQSYSVPFQIQYSELTSYLSSPAEKTITRQTSLSLLPHLTNNTDYSFAFGISNVSKDYPSSLTQQYDLFALASFSNAQKSNRNYIPTQGRSGYFRTSYIQSQEPVLNPIWQIDFNFNQYLDTSYLADGSIKFELSGFYLDQTSLVTNYLSTQSWIVGNSTSSFVARGYPTGGFFAPRLAIGSIEYWLPAMRVDWDWGMTPLYAKQLFVGFVSDFIAANGYGVQSKTKSYQRIQADEIFQSWGAEGVLNANLGYHFNFQLVLGLYYQPSSRLSPEGNSWNLGFRL